MTEKYFFTKLYQMSKNLGQVKTLLYKLQFEKVSSKSLN